MANTGALAQRYVSVVRDYVLAAFSYIPRPSRLGNERAASLAPQLPQTPLK